MKRMQVQQVFRKPIPEYFSLENVFSNIREPLEKWFRVSTTTAISERAHPLAVLKNLWGFRKLEGDVFHVTGDIHYAVFAFSGKKTVLTIHDCVFLYNKTGVHKWIFLWFWLKLPVRHVRFVTTISEATKKDIIQHTGCAPSKVIVINNPMDVCFTFSPKPFNATRPLILQMGTWTNKNLERVIEALAGLSCHLTIIGKLSDAQLALLKQSNIDYLNHFNLSKEELIAQYKECDMVVFASTFEGFGLPVIEAQATGRPLVTSNLSPMKDVAGEGACFADPYDSTSIRNCVDRIIADPAYRESIVRSGLENIKRFNPETVAAAYASVYAQAGRARESIKTTAELQ